jgi:hypothetical protein
MLKFIFFEILFYRKYFFLQGKKTKKSEKVFENISVAKIQSSKLIHYSTNMCWSGQGYIHYGKGHMNRVFDFWRPRLWFRTPLRNRVFDSEDRGYDLGPPKEPGWYPEWNHARNF